MSGASPCILVCGGTGGIGSAVCAALPARGYRPIVGYARSRELARSLAASLDGQALAIDLGEPPSIEAALEHLGQPDLDLRGVVLAATAPLTLEPIARVDPVAIDLQWRIHVRGPHQLVAGLVRQSFRKPRRGHVVGVLSQAIADGERPAMPLMGAYGIAKQGLRGLLDALRADYPWLTVEAVSPGFTRTSLLEAFDARFLEQIEQREPIAEPSAVAREIVARLPPEAPRSGQVAAGGSAAEARG